MLLLGVAHYPELWPSDIFVKDLELMKKIGVNVVRIAEFTWSLMEPEEGRYDFAWLHRLIEFYRRSNINVILGTPTAAPPPWMVKRYPEILPVDYNGIPSGYGVRREYCPNNPLYRVFTERIVSRLAQEFKNDDTVIGFQIDNEVHWGEASAWRYCYCKHCVAKFREYLRSKYGDIENLNKAMGTLVWSHKFNDFDEIIPPKPPLDLYNRSLTIEWLRFRSLSWVDYVRFQAKIIKRIAPHKFVTTNLMGVYQEIDYYELCKDLDICSTDVYPKFSTSEPYDPTFPALIYDATRNMCKSRRFIVMEMQTGATDGYGYLSPEGIGVVKLGIAPEPGEIRKWVYQAIAHGAEGILFWDWRTRPIGKEQFWHGILDHDGTPRRRFYEVERTFNELRKISEIIEDTVIEAKIAILLSYDSLWASDIIEKGYYTHTYMYELVKAYKAAWLNRTEIDIISPNSSFEGYELLIAPYLYLADENLIDKLKSFVQRGGTLVVTPRSFTKDEYNRVRIDKDKVDELIGAKIKEYTRLPTNTKIPVLFLDQSPLLRGVSTYGDSWIEVYELTTATPIAYTKWKWFADEPIVIANKYGKGDVITIGTILSQDVVAKIVKELMLRKNIVSSVKEFYHDPNVEYYVRKSRKTEKYSLVFIINHEDVGKKIKIGLNGITEAVDVLTGEKIVLNVAELELKAYDIRILLAK